MKVVFFAGTVKFNIHFMLFISTDRALNSWKRDYFWIHLSSVILPIYIF
ncbi:hypothetical protein [Bacillus paranthracis]